MKIKLIAPGRKAEWPETFWDLNTLRRLAGRRAFCPPAALATLAALTPRHVQVSITDENVEPIDFDEDVDLVGITGMTCVIPRAYEIADEFRDRGVPVVMGGVHVSMMPEEAIWHCDAVVIGEAEETWEQVVADAEKGDLKRFYRTSGFPDLSRSPIPRWDLLNSSQYAMFSVQTGRGCPYHCSFCQVRIFNGGRYRHRRIDDVVREIETLRRTDKNRWLFLSDDNLLAVPQYAENLLGRLVGLGVKNLWCQASINRLKNERMLDLLHKAGCRCVFVGFESVSASTLSLINKSHVNKVEEYKDVVDRIHARGIAVFGSFLLGCDTDDQRVFSDTAEFIRQTKILFSMINILTPIPGTALARELEIRERTNSRSWDKYNGEHVCFVPKLLSREELERGQEFVLRKIYDYDNLLERFRGNCCWGTGNGNGRKPSRLPSKEKLLLSLKSLSWADRKRARFVLKNLWNRNAASVQTVALALNWHDFAFGKRRTGGLKKQLESPVA